MIRVAWYNHFRVFASLRMDTHAIWNAVLGELELTVSRASFTTWFRSTGITRFENGEIIICVPNAFTKAYIEKKYHQPILHCLERITGKPVRRIDYQIESMKNYEPREVVFVQNPGMPAAANPLLANLHNVGPAPNKYGLNAKYIFETFVVGKGNELAHAAAQAVATRPGEAYNPLFVYGGVGLGKTHLLQAIGNQILAQNGQKRVLYVTIDTFTNDFINAVREGRAKEVKDLYRAVDVLIIDDVQFISGKERTQEEFFHTFNELHQQRKQIVISSDRPPKAIAGVEDRLRSRMEWGMIVDVAPPDIETRVAILDARCRERCFPIDLSVLQSMATIIQTNIRELEGALNKVIAYHQLKNTIPSEDSVRAILSSLESASVRSSITPKQVVTTVAEFYGIAIENITGQSREKRYALPRQVIMFLMRKELNMSFPAIGGELGGRDHTTAMHAHGKIERGTENDLKLRQEIEMIKQRMYVNSAQR